MYLLGTSIAEKIFRGLIRLGVSLRPSILSGTHTLLILKKLKYNDIKLLIVD